ncbi:MAG: CPBP family intramembrane metalloprotease [Treponema sp.]|nr:CPBP family intramembrane metalloprotease [Treponema sp.]
MLGLAGLCVPMITALALILPDKEMRAELVSACTNFKRINWKGYIFTVLYPPASILAAQAISLLIGHSPEQFKLVERLSFAPGIFPAWVILLTAPIIEEFGWHTYGIHCIRRRFSLFATCFFFGVFWGVWHIPASTISGSYQNVVAEIGVIHSINFLVSLIPFLIIDNWTYYKTKRNMFLQISQHFAFNFGNEIFRTHPDSKVIQTVLLIIFSTIIVIRERKFFFGKTFDKENDPCSVT